MKRLPAVLPLSRAPMLVRIHVPARQQSACPPTAGADEAALVAAVVAVGALPRDTHKGAKAASVNAESVDFFLEPELINEVTAAMEKLSFGCTLEVTL
jgi:hypothetical protein